jgi:hypothetical protein
MSPPAMRGYGLVLAKHPDLDKVLWIDAVLNYYYYNLFFLVKEIDVQTSNKFGIILKTIYVF